MNFGPNFQENDSFHATMEADDGFAADFGQVNIEVGASYNDLRNKPTLNGRTIQGDVQEADPTVPDWAKAPVKPKYSADEVGAIPVGAKLGAADLEYMWDTTEI